MGTDFVSPGAAGSSTACADDLPAGAALWVGALWGAALVVPAGALDCVAGAVRAAEPLDPADAASAEPAAAEVVPWVPWVVSCVAHCCAMDDDGNVEAMPYCRKTSQGVGTDTVGTPTSTVEVPDWEVPDWEVPDWEVPDWEVPDWEVADHVPTSWACANPAPPTRVETAAAPRRPEPATRRTVRAVPAHRRGRTL